MERKQLEGKKLFDSLVTLTPVLSQSSPWALSKTEEFFYPPREQLLSMSAEELENFSLTGIAFNQYCEFNFLFSDGSRSQQRIRCDETTDKHFSTEIDAQRLCEIYTKNAHCGYGQVLEAFRIYPTGLGSMD